MFRRPRALPLAFGLVALSASHAQISPPPNPAKPDYSHEAAIIEQMSTKIGFDNDGNLTGRQTSRIRVQTDGGVQQWGLLNFPFQSATQTEEIDYVRVRKPDGSTLITPPDNVQELDSEVTRSAPFYSDLREKHVAVKGLAKGDILEYEVDWHSVKPLVPGQFWYQYNFHHDGIVLDERLEIRVPSERAVKVKGLQATQSVTNEANARIYSWTYSQLQNSKEGASDQKKMTEAALGRLRPPDVQISSFQSWEDVGRWYFNLQKDRIEPTAAIRAKASELTKGLTDDAAKVHALYSFVSLQYRYIGIAFGIGRYQPHAADDVLSNNYGDCKDKHTLLASLLQAAGITLYPALINSSWKLDPDVPSPAQFDHVIGYLPSKNKDDKDAGWLDTTPEVAPFGYLLPVLRDKQALVMLGEKPAQLITTPADPPLLSTQTFKIDGKLNDNGSLDAKVETSAQGDREVPVRAAFRHVPQSQWKDLVQSISYALGYSGTVSDVSASAPETTTEPFHFSYSYNRRDYPDWSNHQLTVPGLPFFMPEAKDDAKDPLWLGSPQESVSDSKVELPNGYTPQLPSNVDLKYDFAEYHATYAQDSGVLTAKRRLLIKLREVPTAEFNDYRSFVKNLQNDVNRYVQTSYVAAPALLNPLPSRFAPFLKDVAELPGSTSAEANKLEADARGSLSLGDRLGAARAFQRVVEVDPKFTRAWLELAMVNWASGQVDSALEAFRKAIESNPKQLFAHRAYAYALGRLHRPEAAMDAWRAALELAPDDSAANSGMGTALMEQGRYTEALPYLETVAKKDNSVGPQNQLGVAYLRAGQIEKGTATLEGILETNSQPLTLNDIAYELAEDKVDLPKALEYARKAVDKQEKESYDVELSNLLPEDLACTVRIGYFWDTLGWVYFRLGRLDEAESFLNAAWLLTQLSVNADHLGQLYEQQKKTEKAIHMYNLALAAPDARLPSGTWDATSQRLEHLTGTKVPATPGFTSDSSGAELSKLRTVKLKPLVPGSERAEFFLLFSPGPKVEDAQFISGSEKLKSAEDVLSEASFTVAFPKGSSARLVRRIMVNCSTVSGCQAVLLDPSSVKSVK